MNVKYILGTIGTIFLLFVVFIFVFNRDDSPTTPGENTEKVSQLTDYADKDSYVSFTTIGKLVGNDEHRSIRITISPEERLLEILGGYEEEVVSSQTYPNTQAAYETFLSALGGQGFTNSKESDISDQRSVCPTGKRYNYDLYEDGESKSSLWTTSCNKNGTFNGKSSTIRLLFQNQIPDYSKQVTNVKL